MVSAKLFPIVLTFSFFIFVSLQSSAKLRSFPPQGTSSLFYKGDIYPRSGMKFVFEFKHCPLDSELLNIKKFEYVLTNSSQPVRIVNIYASRSNLGKKCGKKLEPVKQSYMIDADSFRTTQYYLTTDADVVLSESKSI